MQEKQKTSDVPEFFTKGFQLNRCYQEDWEEIKRILKKNNLKINDFGPVLTINELKYIGLGEKFVEEFRKEEHLIKSFNKGFVDVDEVLLTLFLRIFPEFAYQIAYEQFIDVLRKDECTELIQQMLKLEGTVKETSTAFAALTKNIIFLLKNQKVKKDLNKS